MTGGPKKKGGNWMCHRTNMPVFIASFLTSSMKKHTPYSGRRRNGFENALSSSTAVLYCGNL